VHGHLTRLEKKGLLHRKATKPSTIDVTRDDKPQMLKVPLLGRVAAGVPILAEEDAEGYIQLPDSMVGSGEHFILEIRGDSMINAGIMNGDFVVVKKQATAKNGVQDGTLDGMFLCSGYPNSNVTELSLSGKIEVITIDQEHLDILTKQYPFYSAFTTQTDEYNLGHEITSVAVKCMLVCSDTFTDDEIYALTKAIYENLDSIKEINAKANYMSLEDALSGIPSDLHPGAARYFAEQGIEIPDYLK
jgi:hypothetical protein